MPSIEGRITELEKEEASLNFRVQQAAATFQEFNDDILKEKKMLDQYRSDVRRLEQEITQLNMEKTKRENTMNAFQDNNETYLKIKQKVKQEIEYILANPSLLLRFALASIFESSRRHPGKFQAMYYSLSTAEIQSLLETSISQNEYSTSQYGYNEDALEKILLDEAEEIYSKLVDNISNRCINELTNDTKSSSQILPVPDIQDSLSTDEVYHTNLNNPDEISISAIMYNFGLQIGHGMQNERSSRTDV